MRDCVSGGGAVDVSDSPAGGRTGTRGMGNGGSGRIARVDRVGCGDTGTGGKGERTIGGKFGCTVTMGDGKNSDTISPRGFEGTDGIRRLGATSRSPNVARTLRVLLGIGVTFVVRGLD